MNFKQNKPGQPYGLWAIIFTVFIDFLGLTLAIPVLTPLCIKADGILPAATSMPIRTILLGILIGIYPLLQFFSAPILGALSDRHGRKKILGFSILGMMVGSLIMALGVRMGNFSLALFSRMLMGALSGNLAVNQSAIADISDMQSRPKYYGLFGAAFGASLFIGPALGGVLSDPRVLPWFYYDIPFWLSAFLCLLNYCQVLFFFPETLAPDHRRQTEMHPMVGFKNLVKAWQDPVHRQLFLVVFFMGFGFNFFTQFNQIFLIDKFAATTSQIGALFSYIGLVAIGVQTFLMRWVANRFKPSQVLPVTLLALAMVFPLMLIAPHLVWIYPIVTFVPIFNGLSFPNLVTVISGLGDKKNQGEILGINQSVQALAQFLPPLLGGFIVGFHYTLPLWISSLSIFIAWRLFVRCRAEQCLV